MITTKNFLDRAFADSTKNADKLFDELNVAKNDRPIVLECHYGLPGQSLRTTIENLRFHSLIA